MVEFGLKLQDNKVSEWSDQYMDYEALKKILKKCKASHKKVAELSGKNPFDFTLLHERYRMEQQTQQQSDGDGDGAKSSSSSAADLKGMVVVSSPISAKGSATNLTTLHSGGDSDEDATAATATEQTALLERHVEEIESAIQQGKTSTATTNTSYSSTVQKTLSNLSDHLSKISGRSSNTPQLRFEQQVRAAIQELDDHCNQFDTSFHGEQKKVTSFYYQKLQELQDRLEYVKESVAQSFGILRRPPPQPPTTKRTSSSLSTTKEEEGSALDDIVMSVRGGKRVSPFPMGHRKQSSSSNISQRMEEIFHRLASSATGNSIGRNNAAAAVATTSIGSTVSISNRHHHVSKLFNAAEQVHLGGVDDDDDDEYYDNNNDNPELDEKRIAEAESIKRALVEQYRSAKLLHNFAIMNITGFVKIVKKFDKTVPDQAGRFQQALDPRNMLYDGKAVDALAEKYEQLYANWFCDGDIRAAKAQMLTKRGDGLEMDWYQLQLGYRMGMCAVLALWVCWDCVWGLVADGKSTIGARAAFPVFRACGGLLLLQWFWGCSVFVWTRYRVNYIYLFDLDPRHVSTPIGIFAEAVNNTLLYMLLMLLYYKSGAQEMPNLIPPGSYPLILVFLTTIKLIFPLRQRKPMWEIIVKVITAPVNAVTFYQTYVGDIFTSMVKIFQDIAWTVCWVLAGDFLVNEDGSDSPFKNYAHSTWYKDILIPILTQIPLLIRFNQCLRKFHDTGDRFPHLANAAKYALSQMVTLAGTFHPLYLEFTGRDKMDVIPFYQILWTVLFVSSSLYSFTWDVCMDWGLGRKKYGYLGPNLMYPRKYYYYCTIALDLVLRFMWVLTLVPPSSGAAFAVPEYLTALSMMLELFRRTVWGFFRLENEHRSNASGYRRVDFVPLHFNTGHQHQYYENKKERSGSQVLTEVVLVTVVVAFFCFASVVAAQHANRALASVSHKEL